MKNATLLLLLAALAGCSAPRATLVSEAEPVTRAARDIAPDETPVAEAREVDARDADARDALRRSLPFIEKEGAAWMEGRVPMQGGEGCVSCHHVGYAVWSHAEARHAGVATSDEADSLADTAIAFLRRPSKPRAMSSAQVLLAEPARADALETELLALQTPAGGWRAVGQFPSQRRPIEESDAIATMYALIALSEPSGEAPLDRVTAARDKGRRWLDEQPPGTSTEWLASRLLLAEAFGKREETDAALRALTDRQGADGGWGFLGGDGSDAFSTGQALHALATVAPAGSDAIRRAIRYLLETQDDDGSWQLPSVAISHEPSANKDDIYRFWGTAWAAIGLARSLRT